MGTKEPKILLHSLLNTNYTERQRLERLQFFDFSTNRIGHNALCYSVSKIFNCIDFDYCNINEHLLRISLKKCFFKCWLNYFYLLTIVYMTWWLWQWSTWQLLVTMLRMTGDGWMNVTEWVGNVLALKPRKDGLSHG